MLDDPDLPPMGEPLDSDADRAYKSLDIPCTRAGHRPGRVVEGGNCEMAVMSVTVMTLKPGRYQDFLEQHARAEALLTKCGAKNVRLIAALAAGQASGSLASTWEADDWAQHGQVMQAFFSGGGAELMASDVGSETSPIASWQSSTYVDIPR